MDLKQLAQHLGLSPTTVSRALNGYSDVSKATRERVAQAAREKGYKPNAMARRLALGRTDAVGLVYPMSPEALSDPLFLPMVEGIGAALEREQIDLLIVPASPGEGLEPYERLVRGRRVDGLVLAQLRTTDHRVDYLREAQVPFVSMGRGASSSAHAWVDFDHAAGMRLAVERLVAQGHRRIGYLHGSLDLATPAMRHLAFVDALVEAHLTLAPQDDILAPADRRGGYAAMLMLASRDDRPTAIVADNHLAGLGAVRALIDTGRQPGRDLSVIVYDGEPRDHLLQDQDLTCIEQPMSPQQGENVAQLLLGLIRGELAVDAARILWAPRLRAGTSDGPAPQGG